MLIMILLKMSISRRKEKIRKMNVAENGLQMLYIFHNNNNTSSTRQKDWTNRDAVWGGGWLVGPIKHELDGNTRGRQMANTIERSEIAELIQIPLGHFASASARMHVLGWVHSGATWQIQLNSVWSTVICDVTTTAAIYAGFLFQDFWPLFCK